MKLEFWQKRIGSCLYLEEKCLGDRYRIGPVCPLLMDALIEERKRYWRQLMQITGDQLRASNDEFIVGAS